MIVKSHFEVRGTRVMGCLYCQRRFEIHTKNELIDCIEWIQDQHHIRSEQVRHLTKGDKRN